MKIVNKTPHEVHIIDENGQVVRTYKKGDSLIRLKIKTVAAGKIDDIPATKTVFGEPEGLPKEDIIPCRCGDSTFHEVECPCCGGNASYGTYYIVSQLVKSALPERKDLLVPAEVVRDEKGNIVGCKSLGR